MPSYCFVPDCKNKIGGHQFPKDEKVYSQWITAIKRAVPGKDSILQPTPTSVVCCNHFKSDDYKETLMGSRKRLLPSAIPSVFSYRPKESPSAENRRARAKDRKNKKERMEFSETNPSPNAMPDTFQVEIAEYGTTEITIDENETEIVEKDKQEGQEDVSTQCNMMPSFILSIEGIERNSQAIQYYTGFDDYDHFMLMFAILGPNVNCIGLDDCVLSAENQFFLTMLKLRQSKDAYEIALHLGVSKTLVSHVFTIWNNFMYFHQNFQIYNVLPFSLITIRTL